MKNSHEERDDEVCAIYVAGEHTAVDYLFLAQAFVAQAHALKGNKVSWAASRIERDREGERNAAKKP